MPPVTAAKALNLITTSDPVFLALNRAGITCGWPVAKRVIATGAYPLGVDTFNCVPVISKLPPDEIAP